MSNWFYVGLAYGLTYLVLGGYVIHLLRKRRRAVGTLRSAPHRLEG